MEDNRAQPNHGTGLQVPTYFIRKLWNWRRFLMERCVGSRDFTCDSRNGEEPPLKIDAIVVVMIRIRMCGERELSRKGRQMRRTQ